jgi:hypothetical protein
MATVSGANYVGYALSDEYHALVRPRANTYVCMRLQKVPYWDLVLLG